MTDDELRDLIEADRAAKCDLTREWRGGASLGFEIKERAVVAEDALRKAAAEAVPRLLDRVAHLEDAVRAAIKTGIIAHASDCNFVRFCGEPCSCGRRDVLQAIDAALAVKP